MVKVRGVSVSSVKLANERAAKQQTMRQVASSLSMQEYAADAAFTPTQMMRFSKKLEDRKVQIRVKGKEEVNEEHLETHQVEDSVSEYHERNPELAKENLRKLFQEAQTKKLPEEVLKAAVELFDEDPALVDESLEFLEETGQGSVSDLARRARTRWHEQKGREALGGRNMGAQAREYSAKGLGTPGELRKMYADITGNPREASVLFEEFSTQFDFAQLQHVIGFMLHSVGADLKSKGSSISRGELYRLMTETRNMQAILWVYRFFQGRMSSVESSFNQNGLPMPEKVTFELLAKLFVRLLRERFPSMEKIFLLAEDLDLSEEELSQIIIFGEMKNAVRGVAPRLFRSPEHRKDVLLAFMEALEELEEQLEEKEDDSEPEDEEEETEGDNGRNKVDGRN